MIRTGRALTASVVSRAAKSSGSFFSKPPESEDRSWDDACPELPSSIHDAPGTGRRPRLPPSAPSAGPAQPESATKPTLHRPALVLPKAAGTPVFLFAHQCASPSAPTLAAEADLAPLAEPGLEPGDGCSS